MLRLLRILLGAIGLPILFTLSQQTAQAHGNEPLPGLAAALAAISVLFLGRAAATEYVRDSDYDLQKDFLWGAGVGGLIAAGLRAAGVV